MGVEVPVPPTARFWRSWRGSRRGKGRNPFCAVGGSGESGSCYAGVGMCFSAVMGKLTAKRADDILDFRSPLFRVRGKLAFGAHSFMMISP
jgi:hypothetical protein